MINIHSFLMLTLVMFSIPCFGNKPIDERSLMVVEENPNNKPDIFVVKEKYENKIMTIPGITGMGIGDCNGEACIVVMVYEKSAQIDQEVPGTLEGYPVKVEVTGSIEALPK